MNKFSKDIEFCYELLVTIPHSSMNKFSNYDIEFVKIRVEVKRNNNTFNDNKTRRMVHLPTQGQVKSNGLSSPFTLH